MSTKRAYRIALSCGAVPFALGVSIFVLWAVTRWEPLMLIGVGALYVGAGLVLVGALALSWFLWSAARTPEFSRRRIWVSAIACAGLLLLNFPVAGGLIVAAVAIDTRYTVVVHNASRERLESVRVFGGGCEESLGSIPPGGEATCSFWIERDGDLELRARSGSTVYAEVIDGYVSSSLGGRAEVTVHDDGSVSVGHGSR